MVVQPASTENWVWESSVKQAVQPCKENHSDDSSEEGSGGKHVSAPTCSNARAGVCGAPACHRVPRDATWIVKGHNFEFGGREL